MFSDADHSLWGAMQQFDGLGSGREVQNCCCEVGGQTTEDATLLDNVGEGLVDCHTPYPTLETDERMLGKTPVVDYNTRQGGSAEDAVHGRFIGVSISRGLPFKSILDARGHSGE